jgi:hypothetical protein
MCVDAGWSQDEIAAQIKTEKATAFAGEDQRTRWRYSGASPLLALRESNWVAIIGAVPTSFSILAARDYRQFRQTLA